VGFSHPVARTLVELPRLAEDENYALTTRKSVPLLNVVDGRLYTPKRTYVRSPSLQPRQHTLSSLAAG
jgi:hypothetical protein